MQFAFANVKLAKVCEDARAARKELPQSAAANLRAKMAALAAYDNLGEIPLAQAPLQFHPLRGDLAGHYAVRIDAKHRIVFRPAGTFVRNADQSPDLKSVSAIEITFVGNYHD